MAKRPRVLFAALIAVSALVALTGALLDPRRAAAAYLAGYEAVLSTVLGVLMLVMTLELTGGRWFESFRPSAERIIGAIPVLGLLFLPLLIAGSVLYPWAASATFAPTVRQTVQAKWPYLTPLFALIRSFIYWIVWIGTGELVRRAAARRSTRPDAESGRRMRRLSVGGLIAVGLTTTFAAFDWLMSRAPDFQSSILGLYWYAGATVAALAALAYVSGVGAQARHALGNLLLTFLLFWAYLAYSQFLIIWIADVPAEVGWIAMRTRGGWGALAMILVIGQFALPFLALLVRQVKQAPRAMAAIGIWVLLMHVLDMYWLVGPSSSRHGISFVWADIATLLFVAASTIAAVTWRAPPASAAMERRTLGGSAPMMRAELS